MSRDFDGVDDIISVASSSSIDNLDPFTWAAWVKEDSQGESNNGKIFWKSSDGTFDGKVLGRNGVLNQFQFSIARTSNHTYNWSKTTMTEWTFIAVTFNSSATPQTHIYENGVEIVSFVSSTDGSGSLTSEATKALKIGNRGNTDRTWDGLISHASIYNRELPLNQIIQIMRYPGSITKGLVDYLHLNGGSPEPDYSGNKNNGTVTGATVSANNPPINGIYYPRINPWMYAYTEPAAAGGLSIPVAMSEYRRRRVA